MAGTGRVTRHTVAMARKSGPAPKKVSKPAKKRLGRPPDTDSADTRQRILDAARGAFAAHGYEVATNRSLAAAAGITSGALYHYFESKLDLYVEIYRDVQTLIASRFEKAVTEKDSFVDRLNAVLDESHQLNIEDRSLAQFLGAVRIDRRRHAEVEAAIGQVEVGTDFFRDLVNAGVKAGEIDKSRRKMVLAYLDTVLAGLTDAVSGDDQRHALAVESVKHSLGGDLLG